MAGHPPRWFHPTLDEVPAGPRVFCFPHAGGNPRTFLGWQPLLATPGTGCTPGIVVIGMPGRGHRAHELPPAGVADLADGAAGAIARVADDHPVYLFGHGLGAVLAFEVARRLRGVPGVRHLIASGCQAPAFLPSARTLRTAGLRGREFAEAVAAADGLPPEIVAAEQLHDLLLPGLQADFRLAAAYEYRPAARLTIGLTLINGTESGTDPAALAPWRDETTREPACHWAPGGHFYFHQRPQAVTEVLRQVVAADATDPAHALQRR